ncbi:MAG: DoxX family protein [Acidobacteriaceae bacterium]
MVDNVNCTTNNRWITRYIGPVTVYLRVALGIDFLSAVADRFGLWGPPGTPSVSWGNFHNFLAYTAKLNPWFPASWIPTIGWTATLCEACFGLALLLGYRTRMTAVLSGLLTMGFAFGMVIGVGIHAPLNYSVFAISAGAFLLAGAERYPWAVDNWRLKVGRSFSMAGQ